MRERYLAIAAREAERILAALPGATPAQRAEVEAALRQLAGRFAHDQTLAIKAWSLHGADPAALEALERALVEAGRAEHPPAPSSGA
jgi:hypothetical protein